MSNAPQTPAVGTTLPRDGAANLARALIVAAALHHDRATMSLDLAPQQVRLLGRGIEAMVAFEDRRREVEALEADCRARLTAHGIAAHKDAISTLMRARTDLRKSLVLAVASLIWSSAGIAAWVLS